MQEAFDAAFSEQTFTTTTFDGRLVPLSPGGTDLKLTWQNRHEYAKLLKEYKLAEIQEHCLAMARGLSAIVPAENLCLFGPHELEARICGNRYVDVATLQAHTKYGVGLEPTAPHVKLFWRAVRSFSDEQRRLLLRFVSGRSRLPSSAEWPLEFTINPFVPPVSAKPGSRPSHDKFLPVAHTCFFSIDLPQYSSEETLRESLLYAISNCMDIDADFNIRPHSN